MIHTIIVEDDFRIADIHNEFLQKIDDVKVVGKAMTGKEALKLIAVQNVDLLLLDVYLPDYLGTDLIHKVREIQPDIDIIIITAANDKVFLEESLRSGVFNYLIKPVTMERFTEVIQDYKQRKRLLVDKEFVDQGILDELFANQPEKKRKQQETLPKGIDRITLSKVKKSLKDEDKKSWSAHEMGKQIGSSRTTARRYLEYLVSIDYIMIEQEYGDRGRPERKYILQE